MSLPAGGSFAITLRNVFKMLRLVRRQHFSFQNARFGAASHGHLLLGVLYRVSLHHEPKARAKDRPGAWRGGSVSGGGGLMLGERRVLSEGREAITQARTDYAWR